MRSGCRPHRPDRLTGWSTGAISIVSVDDGDPPYLLGAKIRGTETWNRNFAKSTALPQCSVSHTRYVELVISRDYSVRYIKELSHLTRAAARTEERRDAESAVPSHVWMHPATAQPNEEIGRRANIGFTHRQFVSLLCLVLKRPPSSRQDHDAALVGIFFR